MKKLILARRARWFGMVFVLLFAAVLMTTTARAQAPLQQRVDALVQSIELQYRHAPSDRSAAREEVTKVLEAWNAIEEPTEVHHQQLNQWLSRALSTTMRSRSVGLPARPHFAEATPQLLTAEEPHLEELAEALATGGSNPSPPNQATQSPNVQIPPIQKIEPRVAKPAVTRSRWSQHPSSAPLEWSDPFVEDSEAPQDPGALRHKTLRPSYNGASESQNNSRVSVNYTELASAIRGYNIALREVNRQLNDDKPLDVAQLSHLVEQLEQLQSERRFFDFYRDGMTHDERLLIPRSMPQGLTHELFRRRAEELIRATPAEDYTASAALRRLTVRLTRLEEARTEKVSTR